jgi:enoyl-CoA hydratase/carnithine racemase
VWIRDFDKGIVETMVMMDTLQALPQPVIARVHALATAAGCQLVATCDLAIAADTAGFAIPGGKAGLFCHTPLVAVARNIGRKRALDMAMTGDAIDAATAADWGLINRAVPAAELDAATLDLISRATRGSTESKAMGKQGYYRQMELAQPQAYALASEIMAAGALTADGQEGIAAFLEKRSAHYR